MARRQRESRGRKRVTLAQSQKTNLRNIPKYTYRGGHCL